MSRLISPTQRIGELDQRVQLQKQVRVPDAGGGNAHEWETQATVWAHVRPQSGSEREHSDRLNAEGGHRVAIRYRSDVNESWRIVWNGRAMNIRFAQDSGGRSLYLVMECEAGVAT